MFPPMPKISQPGLRRFNSRTRPEPWRSPEGSPETIMIRLTPAPPLPTDSPDGDEEDRQDCDRLKRPFLRAQPPADFRLGLGVLPGGVRLQPGHEARNPRAVPDELVFKRLEKVFFLDAHDKRVLPEKVDHRGHGQPERVGHDSEAEVQEHVPQVERVSDMGEGPPRNEKGPSHRSRRAGLASGDRDAPEAQKLAAEYDCEASAQSPGVRPREREHRRKKGDWRVAAVA